jgi:hypothetical protein
MILSSVAWFVLALHLPVILWAALLDDFATFNMWADKYLQPRLPGVLKSGKGWTTWVHHGLISALITLYATLWGLVLPDSWVVGARLGSGIAFALYGIREIYNWRHHKREGTLGKWKLPYGWGIDGVMDTLGPILIHLWTWTQ